MISLKLLIKRHIALNSQVNDLLFFYIMVLHLRDKASMNHYHIIINMKAVFQQ
jgi:hypothetical protein